MMPKIHYFFRATIFVSACIGCAWIESVALGHACFSVEGKVPQLALRIRLQARELSSAHVKLQILNSYFS